MGNTKTELDNSWPLQIFPTIMNTEMIRNLLKCGGHHAVIRWKKAIYEIVFWKITIIIIIGFGLHLSAGVRIQLKLLVLSIIITHIYIYMHVFLYVRGPKKNQTA